MAYANMTEPVGTVWFQGKKISFPMSSVKIYEGSCVFLSSGKALYTAASGYAFGGIAAETADNSQNTGETVSVYTEGCYQFKSSSLSENDLGKTVYLVTSANPNSVTVTKPTGEGAVVAPIGKIAKVVSETECMVRIDGFAMKEDVL